MLRLEKANESKYLNRREKCPDDLFENLTISLLNKWLPVFVVEARREDGKRYHTAMIYQLLAALWRAARIICLGPPTRVIWLISQVNLAISLSCLAT